MEEQIIQGLSIAETVFAFIFILFTFVFLGIISRHEHIFHFSKQEAPEQGKNDVIQAKQKPPEFSFSFIPDESATLCHYGKKVIQSSTVNGRVHFFWVKGGQEAMPARAANETAPMKIEQLMIQAVKRKIKEDEEADGKGYVVKGNRVIYTKKSDPVSKFRQRNKKKTDIELTY